MKRTPLCEARELGAKTPEAMRAAIFKSRYDRDSTSALVAQCDDAARLLGLDGEDAMTLLAFHAMCQVEELHQQLFRYLETAVHSPFVVKP